MAVVPGRRRRVEFTDSLRGTLGFFSFSGEVPLACLSTQIGVQQLRLLKTARQVLPREQLRISELMQRDIDDGRIREEIVRYLRPTPVERRPIFFPPLVAAIVIKDNNDASEASLRARFPCPTLEDGRYPRVKSDDDDIWYENRFYGDAFGVRVPLFEQDGEVPKDIIPHGVELCWNRDSVDLLVLDGQHRLVALKAALGLLEPEDLARGYEDAKFTEDELDSLGFDSVAASIVFPLTYYDGNQELDDTSTLVSVYRQIFVDVNKNARPVTEARNILLNERDLIAIFTRAVIEQFAIESELPRDEVIDQDTVPLYSFEWDSPARKENQLSETRSISSVGILYEILRRLLLGPEDSDEYFRTELGVEEGDPELDPEAAELDGVPVDQVSSDHFSEWQCASLLKRFKETWVGPIVHVLRNLAPYREVIDALEQQRIRLNEQSAAEPHNPVPRHALEYLLGTRCDQAQLVYISEECEQQVGRYDPQSVARALSVVQDDFYNRILKPKRDLRLAKLFLSNLGQTELFEFAVVTLFENVPGKDVDFSAYAAAFVTEFNAAFEENYEAAKLFDLEAEWNVLCIARLGTQRWKRAHVGGLLAISTTFFKANGILAGIFGGAPEWDKVRKHLYTLGTERVSDSLRSRLPYQHRYDSDIVAIEDQVKRNKKLGERVEQRSEEILDLLRRFVEDEAST